MRLQQNVPLAPLTTFQVGGPAKYFVEATTAAEVQEAVEFARQQNLPLFVLGGGSNLVISDQGWPGLVLKVAVPGIAEHEQDGKVIFDVGAGEEWDKFVAHAVAQHCAGVECLSGIPGSVGGTPVQNVGAYGQEVAGTIHSVLAYDLKDNQVHELTHDDCCFSYRASLFNTTEKGRYIILRVTYAMVLDGPSHIEYADLKQHFAGWAIAPSLAQVRDAVRHIRANKGMLLTPEGGDCRSAGSFFKNPVLSSDQHAKLIQRASVKGLIVPSYPALESRRKISAAWLLEHSGFSKGYVSGRVGISRKHALALVNLGGASAEDVIALQEEIQQRVEESWGIRLEPEPVFVGF